VGASTLIDELIKLENNIVIASDISSTSLEKLKKRIGIDKDKMNYPEAEPSRYQAEKNLFLVL